tara:strand:+ start:2076 stop:2984 length:909 start_codon:yes stop_codon:yes gene_type:complete
MKETGRIGISGGGFITITKVDGRQQRIPFKNTIQTVFKNSLAKCMFNGGNNTGIRVHQLKVNVVNTANSGDVYSKTLDESSADVDTTTGASGSNYTIRYEASFGSASNVWDSTSGSGASKSFYVGSGSTQGLQLLAHNGDTIMQVAQPISTTQIDNNDTVNIDYTLTLVKPTPFTANYMTAIRTAITAAQSSSAADSLKLHDIYWRTSAPGTYQTNLLVGIQDATSAHGSASGRWNPVGGSAGAVATYKIEEHTNTNTNAPHDFQLRNASAEVLIESGTLSFTSPSWTSGDRMKVDYTVGVS